MNLEEVMKSSSDPMITLLPDHEYDAHMTQLLSLPPRQQARWKKTLNHRTGKSTLFFKEGVLVDRTEHGEKIVTCMRILMETKGKAAQAMDAMQD